MPNQCQLIFTRCLDPPKFDLESYIANYTGKLRYVPPHSSGLLTKDTIGRTRFDRLFLIGTCSSHLSTEALKLAVSEAKSSKDVPRYEKAVRALADTAPSEQEAKLDTEWVDRMHKIIKAESDRLEQELRGYKNNLIKESIRVCILLQW